MALSPASLALPRMRKRRMPSAGSMMMSVSDWKRARRCLCDNGHHAGFGAEGDHADDVEDESFAFGKRIEGLMPVEFGDRDVARGVPALLIERLALGAESVAAGLGAPGGFAGIRGDEIRRIRTQPCRTRQLCVHILSIKRRCSVSDNAARA